MKITRNFTFEEMIASTTARLRGIQGGSCRMQNIKTKSYGYNTTLSITKSGIRPLVVTWRATSG